MINWLIKLIMSNNNIGVATAQELAKHRLHTTKYEDLCMQEEYHMAEKSKGVKKGPTTKGKLKSKVKSIPKGSALSGAQSQ